MKGSRFTEEKIIGVLKEHQAGFGAKGLCRKHGVSDATFYKWRSKFGGLEVSGAKKLNSFEAKNAELKKSAGRADDGRVGAEGDAGKKLLRICPLSAIGPSATGDGRICAAARRGLGHDTEGVPVAAGLRFGGDQSPCLSAMASAVGGF